MASFKIFALIPSGPGAPFSFNSLIFVLILSSVISILFKKVWVSDSRTGTVVTDSCVNTLAKNLFSSSAIARSSVSNVPSLFFNGPIVVKVLVFDLIYAANFLPLLSFEFACLFSSPRFALRTFFYQFLAYFLILVSVFYAIMLHVGSPIPLFFTR